MKKYQDEFWLRQKIEVEGKTRKEIAEMFGVTIPTISYFAHKYGIDRPGNTKSKKNMENSKKLRDKEFLHYEYITLNKSYGTIAEEYEVGKTTVARWVKKHGLDKLKNIKTSGKRVGDLPKVNTNCFRCQKPITVKGCRYAESSKRFCSKYCSNMDNFENNNLLEIRDAGLKKWRESEEGKRFMRKHGAKVVASIEGRETSIERKIRELLTEEGIEFEAQKVMYYWCVDFYLPKYDVVIEAHGDYWHAHPDVYPEPNEMQRINIRRDKGKKAYLTKCGHKFLAFWERDINRDIDAVRKEILNVIRDVGESIA